MEGARIDDGPTPGQVSTLSLGLVAAPGARESRRDQTPGPVSAQHAGKQSRVAARDRGDTALALDERVLSQSLGHHAGLVSYLKITWRASSLATLAGALGAGLESDAAVCEAAYGYRPERESERERT